jgi:hypothetical protein
MNVKINGNKSNALGTLAALMGGSTLIPESIMQTAEPSIGIVLALIGLLALSLRHAITKLEDRLPPKP